MTVNVFFLIRFIANYFLGLSQDAATRTSSATPLGSMALHIYRMMCNSGYDQKDFGSAYEFLKKK